VAAATGRQPLRLRRELSRTAASQVQPVNSIHWAEQLRMIVPSVSFLRARR